MQLALSKKIHFEGSLGAGGYIGSLQNTDFASPVEKNGGYTVSVKVGLGIALN